MKFKILFLTLTLVLAYESSLFAQHLPSDASPVRVLRVALDLTDDQVSEIRNLMEVRTIAIKSTTDQIHLHQAQLEEVVQSDAPDPLEVGELVLTVRLLREEIGQHHEQFQVAFRSLLTPLQMERLGHIQRIAMANRAAEALGQLKLR